MSLPPLGAGRRVPWPLLLIWLWFILLSLVYRSAVPAFEGPDEPEHFAYVEWLAAGWGFPPQGDAAWATPVRQQAGQAPLVYLLAAWPARWLGSAAPGSWLQRNPHFPSDAPGDRPDNKNYAVHHPQQPALTAARTVSLLFGLLLVTAVYGLAAAVDPRAAAPAAALVAATPQLLFLANVVSNDVPAAALSAVVLWALARLAQRGPSHRRALALGAALGLAWLAKSNTLILGAPVALGLSYLWWTAPPTGRRAVWRTALIAAVAATAVAGWWYVRNRLLYGAWLGLEAHGAAPWAQPLAVGRAALWREVFLSWWAAFGWGNIKPGGLLYAPFWVAAAAAVAGGLLRALRRPRRLTPVEPLLWVTVAAAVAALAYWMQQVTAPHGRLLYPALGAAAVAAVLGWRAWHPALPWAVACYTAGLALWVPGALLRPAYAAPAPAAAEPAPLGWRFGEAAELLRATPDAPSVTAGAALTVEVCWRALAPTARDLSVLVQLVGPADAVIARRATYPGLGALTTTTWTPGQVFCDPVRLAVPADTPQTLAYRLLVALFDHTTGERPPVLAPDGRPPADPFVGSVRVQGATTRFAPLPADALPLGLVDAQLPAQPADPLALVWQAAAPLDRAWTTYVHWRDDAGRTVAQADGPPLDGWYPTQFWQPGELVVDRRAGAWPTDAPPGRYTLAVGWYDPLTAERLGSEFTLGSVEVRP